MAEIVITNLCKSFGAVNALQDINLTIGDGEFVSLLGPSGCGKSTTLGALAGLDRPTSGSIVVGGKVFFEGATNQYLPPEKRNAGLVFQSYALWPHLTVAQNLEFPLKLRKVGKTERVARIDEVLSLVEMSEYAMRYPFELSGGQQQRVALARTLVYRPSILLLDEPLSNLDTQLRDKARDWLKQIHGQIGITTVYVTHDQSEALALSDRIVVMNKGRAVQIGTPQDVYLRPADPFVAEFIGASNFVEGKVVGKGDGSVTIDVADAGRITAMLGADHLDVGDEATVAVRPESVELRPGQSGSGDLRGEVLSKSYQGARNRLAIKVGAYTIRGELASEAPVGPVTVKVHPKGTLAFARR